MKALSPEVLAAARRVHLVGAGGIGVSALAELFLAEGLEVSGSDQADSPRLRAIEGLGVEVVVGTSSELAARADLLVHTSAAALDHPERVAARARGVPECPRGAALAGLVARRRGVGIGGAHGKTSTTALLGWLLAEVGADPSVAVGGVVAGWNSPVRTGQGELFVAEADESDRSFLALDLDYALALNLDWDHLENYQGKDDLVGAYRQFLAGAKKAAVVFADDPELSAMLQAWDSPPAHLIRVGAGEDADLRIGSIQSAGGWVEFQIHWRGKDLGRFRLPRPGVHNANNAASALAILLAEGFDPESLKQALATFPGVDRRFTQKGDAFGVRVLDDYAHLPKEVAATLAAAREAYPERRLVAVFQPHLYSRTKAHGKDFAQALAQADLARVLEVYGAREDPVPGVDSAWLAAFEPEALAVLPGDLDQAAATLGAELQDGDLVLTLGAGSVTRLGPKLLAGRRRRELSRRIEASKIEAWVDEPLARFNSFKTGGKAPLVARPKDRAELSEVLGWIHQAGLSFKTLGGGTNILVSDQGLSQAVIVLGSGFSSFEIEDDGVTFRAGAGITTGKLFQRLKKAGIGGFEWFHHVPGTLGGAVVNNSGAYGQDLRGLLLEVEWLDAEGKVHTWGPEEWDAEYRRTAFKGRSDLVLLSARCRGETTDPATIQAEAKRQASLRNQTQPGGKGSVGCAFKNPPDASAGRMIDAAGLKGRALGGAQVSTLHGNFILNAEGASSTEIYELAREVKDEILEKNGIELELEIETLGPFAPFSRGGPSK